MIRNAIATICALLFGITTLARAEEGAPAGSKRAEAKAFCQDKPVDSLIGLLGHENYHYRQCAEERLQQLLIESPADQPNAVEKACYQAFREDSNPEVRIRTLTVLTHYATHLWSPGGFLGLAVSPHATFGESGEVVTRLRVTKVLERGPAARAGLRADDLILSMDEAMMSGTGAEKKFEQCLSRKTPGEKLLLRVNRGEQVVEATAVLGKKNRSKKLDKDGKEIELDAQKCLQEYLETMDRGRGQPATDSDSSNDPPPPRKS